jgi:hypothetical protein
MIDMRSVDHAQLQKAIGMRGGSGAHSREFLTTIHASNSREMSPMQ